MKQLTAIHLLLEKEPLGTQGICFFLHVNKVRVCVFGESLCASLLANHPFRIELMLCLISAVRGTTLGIAPHVM